MVCRSLFVLLSLSLWPLRCLSFCPFPCGHCVVCPSVPFLVATVLSVLLRITAFDYSFGIFKNFSFLFIFCNTCIRNWYLSINTCTIFHDPCIIWGFFWHRWFMQTRKIMEICMFNLEEFGRHYALVDRYADASTLRYGICFRFCVSFPTLDLVSAFTWLFPHTLKIKAMSNVNQELLTLCEHLRSPVGFWLFMRWSSLVFCGCLRCICLSYILATCSFLYIDLNTLNKQIFDRIWWRLF